MKRIAMTFSIAILLAATRLTLMGHAQGPQGARDFIVVFHDDERDVDGLAGEHGHAYGASVSQRYHSAFKGYAATIPLARLADIRRDPRVAFVSEDRPVTAVAQTLPTGVDRIDGEISSHAGSNDWNIAVAVIDTGSGPHSDLNVVGGKNCSTGKSFSDGNGHGTHVAGTIGAIKNGAGVVGVAPGIPIYSVRVLNNAGSGSWSSVACGIDWVTANASALKIKVVNMSLGGAGTDDGNCGSSNGDALHKAICRSVAAGVTYVVAAGNDNRNLSGFVPAAYDEVLAVTAWPTSTGNREAARPQHAETTLTKRRPISATSRPSEARTRTIRLPRLACAFSRRGRAAATTPSPAPAWRRPTRRAPPHCASSPETALEDRAQ